MVGLTNDGWPGGEALQSAVERLAHFWRMEDKTVAVPLRNDLQDQDEPIRGPPSKAPRRNAPGPCRQALDPYVFHKNGKPLSKLSQDSNGNKFCGKFNSAKGCTRDERDCPQKGIHGCNIRLRSGQGCGRRDHTWAEHFSY